MADTDLRYSTNVLMTAARLSIVSYLTISRHDTTLNMDIPTIVVELKMYPCRPSILGMLCGSGGFAKISIDMK